MAFFNQFLNNGRAMFTGNGELDLSGYHEVPAGSSDMFVDEVHNGLKNLWYGITGQTEKTSAYKAQMEREDSAYQRMAQDLSKAGLSKYFGGTPSSTGSYGDGLPKGLQYAAALLDMKSAEAGIRKTNAEANLTDAQAVGQENENRTFDESHEASIAESLSKSRWNNAQSQIAETEGQFTAEKITTELAYTTQKIAQTIAETLYTKGESLWQDVEHESQVSQRESSVQLNSARVENLRKSTQYISQQIAESVAREYNLSMSSKKLVADTAYRDLLTQVVQSDWEYSIWHQIRYKDDATRILGVNADQLSNALLGVQKFASKTSSSFGNILKLISAPYRSILDAVKEKFL